MNCENYTQSLSSQILKLKYQYDYGNDANMMIYVINETKNKFPHLDYFTNSIFTQKYGPATKVPPSQASICSLKQNIDCYIVVLSQKIQIINNGFLVNTIQTLYHKQFFNKEEVLFTKDYNQLKVSDLLSVIKYVVKVINSFTGIHVDDRFSQALTVFSGLDLLLHNNKADKPTNKVLHIANDVFFEIIDKYPLTEEERSLNPKLSLAIDLTIDFLVKG